MIGNKTFLLLLAMEVLLDALRCPVRALSAPFYGNSIAIPFIYVFILGSFYSSGLPYDFQKACVSFRSSYAFLHPSFSAPFPFNPPIPFPSLPLSSYILFPPPL